MGGYREKFSTSLVRNELVVHYWVKIAAFPIWPKVLEILVVWFFVKLLLRGGYPGLHLVGRSSAGLTNIYFGKGPVYWRRYVQT